MPSNIEATKSSTSTVRTTSASRTCRPPLRCQFHQHFKSSFFVQKCFSKLFSNYSLVLNFFGERITAQNSKAANRMLMKLTTGKTEIFLKCHAGGGQISTLMCVVLFKWPLGPKTYLRARD